MWDKHPIVQVQHYQTTDNQILKRQQILLAFPTVSMKEVIVVYVLRKVKHDISAHACLAVKISKFNAH